MTSMRINIIFRMLLACLCASSAASALPPDIGRIKKSGKLIIAQLAEDSPPFFYKTGNRFYGYDIDIAGLIAHRLGVKAEFKRNYKTFDEVINGVEKGEADIAISALYPSLDRAQRVRFTRPYYKIAPVLIANRMQTKATIFGILPSIERFDSPQATIGFYDAAMFPVLIERNFHHAKTVKYAVDGKRDIRLDIAQAMFDGHLTAFYTDEIEAAKWRKLIPKFDLYFRIIPEPVIRIPVSIAVRWQDVHLSYWLDSLLDEVNIINKDIKNETDERHLNSWF